MAFKEDDFPLSLLVFSIIFYITVFITSLVGNLWIIVVTFYATIKQRRTHNHFTWLVANLAFADLVFTFLTIFNTISFHWRWPGGDSTCKFHGFLVEATYTTSISTLVVISYQRRKAVIHPFKAKFSCWARMKYMKLAIIWGLCFSVCSPLFCIYRVETQINGDIVCVTTTWGGYWPTNILQFAWGTFLRLTFSIYDCHTDKHS